MAIKIIIERQRDNPLDIHCPKVICDVCGQVINNVQQGYYEYEIDPFDALPTTGDIYTVHKRCSQTLHDRTPTCSFRVEELRKLTPYLAANMRLR